MILEDMTPLDIKFGDTEGKREFSNDENINNMFFLNEYKRYIKDFIDGDKRYIYGLKGTGKSSLLKYLENNARHQEITTMYISYKDFREEADVINSFREELKNTEDKDMYALTFWRWYILSLISKQFLSESSYNTKNLIYNSKVRFFKVFSKVLDLITEFSVGTEATKFNLKIGTNENNGPIVKWESTTADRIRDLELSIKNNLSNKSIIFIDELELSTLSSSYEMDSILIKNLIKATRKINELSSNLHIVLAVRSEVINSISASGDEINKELEDFGYEIEWHRRKFDIEHPLIKMYIKKIRYAMIKFVAVKDSKLRDKIDKMTEKEIWYRWFPEKIQNTNSPEFILQNTWLRPRDLSRLFRTMQKYCLDTDNVFKQNSYEEAIKKVGEDSWKEIEEELSSKYKGKDVEKIRDVLEKVQIIFLKEDFIRECKLFNLNDDDIENILHDLYKLSAIGNHFKTVKYSKLKTIYRFFYRNDRTLYTDKAITVHKALEKGLGLSDFNSSLLFNALPEADKQKYMTGNYNYQDPFETSLADRFSSPFQY